MNLASSIDDTAINFQSDGTALADGMPDASFLTRYPRLFAALQDAAARTTANPRRAADALVTLSTLAIFDRQLGDPMTLLNRVLEPRGNALRKHLSDEATAVFKRSVVRVLANDVGGALCDCVEAMRLAKEQYVEQVRSEGILQVGPGCVIAVEYDFTGLEWSWKSCAGKALLALGRGVEAFAFFEELVETAEEALSYYPLSDEKEGLRSGTVRCKMSPMTGGRERDPHKLAKVVECEYGIASLLLEAYHAQKQGLTLEHDLPGKPSELLDRGRARYESAVACEASLPKEAVVTISGTWKIACQSVLILLPATKKNQAAMNAESRAGGEGTGGSSVLECHTCGRVDHDGLKTSSACKSAAYCSIKCQKTGWPSHKAACREAVAQMRSSS